MKTILLTLLSLMVFSVFAQSPAVLLTSDSGALVGSGKLDDNAIEMDLLAGFSGFAHIQIDLPNQDVTQFEAVVNENGDIQLRVDGVLVSLTDFLAAKGWGLEIGRDDNINAGLSGDSGNDSTDDNSKDSFDDSSDDSDDSNSDDADEDSSDDSENDLND